MSNKYYIFRHGETYATKNKTVYGDTQFTAEILPEGISTIRRLAEYLKDIKTHENYVSELLRAQQTAKIVEGITGKKFKNEPLLNEYMEPSFELFKERVKTLVDRLESAKGKTYLLCTHGDVIAAFRYFLTENEFTIEQHSDYPAPGTLAIIKEGECKLLDFN